MWIRISRISSTISKLDSLISIYFWSTNLALYRHASPGLTRIWRWRMWVFNFRSMRITAMVTLKEKDLGENQVFYIIIEKSFTIHIQMAIFHSIFKIEVKQKMLWNHCIKGKQLSTNTFWISEFFVHPFEFEILVWRPFWNKMADEHGQPTVSRVWPVNLTRKRRWSKTTEH